MEDHPNTLPRAKFMDALVLVCGDIEHEVEVLLGAQDTACCSWCRLQESNL